MGIRLVVYLGILMIGIFIGFKEISHKKVLDRIHHLQMMALLLLLFVMGIRIGADEKVMGALGTLGVQAFVIAAASIFMSVLFVFIYRKGLRLNKKGEKE